MNVIALQQVNRDLSNNLKEKNTQLDNLKVQFNREVNAKIILQNSLARIERENQNLLQQIDNIEQRCKELKAELEKYNITTHYKSYSQLNSKSGRQRRKRDCKRIFENVLKNAGEITSANISLKLGTDNLDLLWGKEQLDAIRGHSNPTNPNNPENSRNELSVETNIIDAEGNFRDSYLKSIIYVMDKHKVSHDAYHEIRMVTKGAMPPLHVIKRAKSKMSEEIEYIKHPTVGHICYCHSTRNFIFHKCFRS